MDDLEEERGGKKSVFPSLSAEQEWTYEKWRLDCLVKRDGSAVYHTIPTAKGKALWEVDQLKAAIKGTHDERVAVEAVVQMYYDGKILDQNNNVDPEAYKDKVWEAIKDKRQVAQHIQQKKVRRSWGNLDSVAGKAVWTI
uniref:Uncharacterized protein n=1 Tax=Chromera velia CCMP2878 TaxID=1169474 RepID=A0A0G4G862_9ALVE|eukprot:Cvel_20725.t1-p1 / transcript=Cvel_20725.t1 / gene=Cvel_20725 / organism=Chromera_velia_CCMP2878 / gene_product=hypothetical protein / transcript_product=hypothetical protein / location=Cvel_scaffold1886:30016-30432(-) / protein_length=139 / sequence_SO=supercontig / SO=protein_coding / is_pseudo=false